MPQETSSSPPPKKKAPDPPLSGLRPTLEAMTEKDWKDNDAVIAEKIITTYKFDAVFVWHVSFALVGRPRLAKAAQHERPADYLAGGRAGTREFPSKPEILKAWESFSQVRHSASPEGATAVELLLCEFLRYYSDQDFVDRLEGRTDA